MTIDPKLVEELLADYKKPEDIIGENGLLKQLTKAILERALKVELTEHVGYEKHDPAGHHSGNSRNGITTKKLKGEFGEIDLETPRDRNGSFEPAIVSKGQSRFSGFDDKIISMYSRGMTTREIEGHLKEIYGVEVSPTLVSNVTEAVMEEVKTWQNRALDEVYPILYMDALRVKVRDGGHIGNRAIHVAMGVNLEGRKEILGLWAAVNEGAKFWMQVLTEIHNRGVKDIFIACVDGRRIRSPMPSSKVVLPCVRQRQQSGPVAYSRELQYFWCGQDFGEPHGSPPVAVTLFPKELLPVFRQGERPKTHPGPVDATTRTPTSNYRTDEGAAVPGRSVSLADCRLHRRESRGRREINSSSHTLAAVHQTPTASCAMLLVVDR